MSLKNALNKINLHDIEKEVFAHVEPSEDEETLIRLKDQPKYQYLTKAEMLKNNKR